MTSCGGGALLVMWAYTRLTARCLTRTGTTSTANGSGWVASAAHSCFSTGRAADGGEPTNGWPASCADCSAEAPPSGSDSSSIGRRSAAGGASHARQPSALPSRIKNTTIASHRPWP